MTFNLFILWTFVLVGRPQDLIPAINSIRPALIVALVTLAFIILGSAKKRIGALLESKETKKYILFFLVMTAGIPFAYHRKVAFEQVMPSYTINMLFFFSFILLVDSFEKLKKVILTITVSTLIYGVFTLVKGTSSSGRLSTYGTMFDPNDIAYVLVSLFPLSLFYLAHKEGFLKKIIAIAAMASAVGVILLTGSRGGFISLAFVALFLLFTNMGGIKKSHKVLFLAAMVVVVVFYSDRINFERYSTMFSIEEDYNVTDEFGRLQIWSRAFQLIRSNPFTGVGANCFSMAIGYLREEMHLTPKWQVAHNSYIQVATEIGLIGFFFFASLIVGGLRTFSKLRRFDIKSPEASRFKTLSSLFMVGFVGHLIAAFFLSQGYSIFFTLFFASSATLNRLANPIPTKKRVYSRPPSEATLDRPNL